ncbi:MAG: hypothetical protein ABII94_03930 [Patescibacteria group bacterium]
MSGQRQAWDYLMTTGREINKYMNEEKMRQVEIRKLLDFINQGVYEEGFDYDVSVENVLENQLPRMFYQAIQVERDRLVEVIEKQEWSTEELRDGYYIIKSIISIINNPS